MNPSKVKGTRFEREVKLKFERWFKLWRTPAGTPVQDLDGGPWPVEVKHRNELRVAPWARRLRERHGDWWVLVMAHGDRRTNDSAGTLVCCPWPVWADLMDRVVGTDHGPGPGATTTVPGAQGVPGPRGSSSERTDPGLAAGGDES
jgi:hypothetical protein